MNCEQAEMLLYLRRPGETSGAEQRELALHLEQCDRCRSLAAKIDAVGPVADALRTAVPRPENPEQLTRSIMRRIPRGHSVPGRVAALERLLDAAAAPVVRYACAAVVVLALGSFTWQSVDLALTLQGLETRMKSPASRGSMLEVVWSVSTEALKPLIPDGETVAALSRVVPGAETGVISVTSEELNTMLTATTPARVMGEDSRSGPTLNEEEIRRVIELARQRGEVRIQIRKQGA